MSAGNNMVIFKKCHKVLILDTSDVQFTFENGDDIVKIPAKKAVLAASSPVFNAMFNGELKEKGDVKITDASPEAFREFLQFFYDPQVNLTNDNIAEVLKLVDKYDIKDGLPVCSDVLKKNLKIDDVLWTLHLAVRFNLDDLKTFCEETIRKNYNIVQDMVGVQEGRFHIDRLTYKEIQTILPHLFAISKAITLQLYKDVRLLNVILVTEEWVQLDLEYESFEFSVDRNVVLDSFTLSQVKISDCTPYNKLKPTAYSFGLRIVQAEKMMRNGPVRKRIIKRIGNIISTGEKNVKCVLEPPITILSGAKYDVTVYPSETFKLYTEKMAIVDDTKFRISSHATVTVSPPEYDCEHMLISKLNFLDEKDDDRGVNHFSN